MLTWRPHYLHSLLCGLFLLLVVPASAEEAQLFVKPARCIALHEGQVCYQTLNINWKASASDSYCLYPQKNPTPIMCWENASDGNGIYEFESNSSSTFVLARKRDAHAIAEFTVEVAWVYDARSHRQSHWRIF